MTGFLPDLLPSVAFVGGKGGVGKTTVAAALAIASAESGARTLLVSTDPAHSTTDVLDDDAPARRTVRPSTRAPGRDTPVGGPVRDSPAGARQVMEGLDLLELDATVEADRYIEDVKARIRDVASPRMLKEVEREVDIARASPGAEEAAVFDRFARLMRLAGGGYDRVLFDTAPTGHTLRLLGLPERMEGWAAGLAARRRKLQSLGRMWRNVAGRAAGSERAPGSDGDPVLEALEARQARFRTAREIVTDPRRAGFLFVVVPERLPILETDRAVEALRRYGIPVLGIVVNRVLPASADGEFLARRRDREASYLTRIDQAFAGLPRWRVPLEDADVTGVAALRRLADGLASSQR